MTRARLVFALCLSLLGVGNVSAASVAEDPIEREMLSIAKDLRCTVCQNQPVAESNADLARDMREIIRDQLQAGKSRAEIVDYFVARDGPYVLMQPRCDPLGAILWVAPLLMLAGVGAVAFTYLRARTRPHSAPTPILSAEDAARVRAERDTLG